MGVLLLLAAVIAAALAGGAWFYLRPKQSAVHPPSKIKNNSVRSGPPSTRTAVPQPESSTRTAVAPAVRNRNKPTELDQKDLFAEFMEKEAQNSPSNANTPTKGSSERKPASLRGQLDLKAASVVTEAPTQMSELSAAATPAITPLPCMGNTPTKDVQTAALLPTPSGDQSTKSASKKKKKKAKKGSRLSMSKPSVSVSSKSKKSKKGKKKKSAGKY